MSGIYTGLYIRLPLFSFLMLTTQKRDHFVCFHSFFQRDDPCYFSRCITLDHAYVFQIEGCYCFFSSVSLIEQSVHHLQARFVYRHHFSPPVPLSAPSVSSSCILRKDPSVCRNSSMFCSRICSFFASSLHQVLTIFCKGIPVCAVESVAV